MANRFLTLPLAILFVTVGFSCHAEQQSLMSDQNVLGASEAQAFKDEGASQISVEKCWEKWTSDEGLHDGKNEKNNHLILVSHTQQAVNAEAGSSRWLVMRKAAFQQSELSARADLANTMRVLIRSDRSYAANSLGGDDPAPNLKPIVQRLSITDKLNVLTGKALDNEISKYDPEWRGGLGPEKTREEAIKLEARFQENIAATSDLFSAGAFTVAQCEGQSEADGGKYSVLVGLIWSPKLAKLAEAIWNPAYKLPLETDSKSLQEQFEAFGKTNADWLAYTLGARVFTNEKGERVVVGFGAAPQTSMMNVDKRRAGLEAMAAIQRFVGERVESNEEEAASLQTREFSSGRVEAYDSGAFTEKVSARAKDLKLGGATEVLAWRGEHPWSRSKMQVVAVAWSPSWAADSEHALALMQEVEQRMDGQGAVPSGTQRRKDKFKGAGAAVPARAGASSSTHDF